jgi:two-component system, NtrC family, nitrogen regulation sensor histidine kinase NtrY
VKYLRKKDYWLLGYALVTLVVAIFITTLLVPAYKTPQRYAENAIRNLKQELSYMENTISTVTNRVRSVQQLDFSSLHVPDKYSYFIFQDDKLVFWSSNRYVPEYTDIYQDKDLYFVSVNRGQFVVRREVLDEHRQLELFYLLPIYTDYAISNQYIESVYNRNVFANSNVKVFDQPSEEGILIQIDGEPLFSVVFEPGYRIKLGPLQLVSFTLFVAAGILLLVFLFKVVGYHLHIRKEQTAFLILAFGLILIRVTLLITTFPFSLIPFRLFNPMQYASSNINPSLGDLLLNMILILVLVLFVFKYYYRFELYQKLLKAHENIKDVASIILITTTFFVLYYIYFLINALNFHSQWNMDINMNIDFPGMKVVSYVIIFVASLIYFLSSHLIYKMFIHINKRSNFYKIFDFVIGALIFVTVSLALNLNFILVVIINTVYIITLQFMGLPQYLSKIQYKTFFYYFYAALSIAVLGAYVIYNFEQKNDLGLRKKLADELLIENDYLGEYLLDEAVRNIKNDAFILGRMLTPFMSKDIIAQKIKEIHLSPYFDRYDVKVYLFGSNGEPLAGNMPLPNYRTFKSELKDLRTEFENIYFRKMMGNRAPKQYMALIELDRFGNDRYRIGHIIIDLRMKRIIPNSVYPELMIDKNFIQVGTSDIRYKDFSYAIISNNLIVYSSGNFNYSRYFNKSYLDNENIFSSGIKANGFRHFARIDHEADRTILVTSPAYPAINVISNFSFLFLVLIFFTLILLVIYVTYLNVYKVKLNYAAKIQLYTNFAFFIPLLAISITTLSVLISSYKREIERDYLDRAETISEELVEPVFDYIRTSSGREELIGKVVQIAGLANIDLNVYSRSGRLLATNQPRIYEKDIISDYINPLAISEIMEKRSNSVILDEAVGRLSYKSSYVSIRYFLTGEMLGILSVPFFDSKLELEQQVILVFTRIVNIFTFVLICSLILSYFASKWLTFPLRLITQKIRRTTLSEYNEPLTWHSNDEIGLMVGEYNRMLENLEESKKALSKSEKESAWREMAKQVAHEIKNPLTPMKLTLQHLRRMLDKEMPDNGSFVEKPINSLLHHVDTLSDIAESFSAFAQMPAPVNAKFEISSLLKQTVSLYLGHEGGTIETEIEEGEFYVIGDAQWMGRIFSNLIINGFQAVPEDRNPVICVGLKQIDNQKILLEFKDNGMGIPENIKEKVFVPNFSTKFTGSGIGLAIAKRGVEHAGGKIWFETEENVGTSFYIELPLEEQN